MIISNITCLQNSGGRFSSANLLYMKKAILKIFFIHLYILPASFIPSRDDSVNRKKHTSTSSEEILENLTNYLVTLPLHCAAVKFLALEIAPAKPNNNNVNQCCQVAVFTA
jgi:hypothetical protein